MKWNIFKKMDKKGQMGAAVAGLTALATVVILMVVIGMVSAFGSQIIQDTTDDINATAPNSIAVNNTLHANEGINNLTSKMPILATVLIGAFIILILISAFAVFGVGRAR